MSLLLHSIAIGAGATALIDLWAVVRRSLFGIPGPNYGMVGRWLIGVLHGRVTLDPAATAPPAPHERVFGWVAHYAIGVAFAMALIVARGPAWLERPTLAPAMIVGISTVIAPMMVMQPGMGAGFAASRTRSPWSARLHSLITHSIFGFGLYATGIGVSLY